MRNHSKLVYTLDLFPKYLNLVVGAKKGGGGGKEIRNLLGGSKEGLKNTKSSRYHWDKYYDFEGFEEDE